MMVNLDSALLLEGLVNTKFTNLSWKLQEMPVAGRQNKPTPMLPVSKMPNTPW